MYLIYAAKFLGAYGDRCSVVNISLQYLRAVRSHTPDEDGMKTFL